MTRYSVEITDTAMAAITAEARYIAIDARAPLNAAPWLEQLWDAVDSLERFPGRAPVAEENAYVEYEIRQLVVENHLLLFTIDDHRHKVWVLGIRHGHRLPRPEELPDPLELDKE